MVAMVQIGMEDGQLVMCSPKKIGERVKYLKQGEVLGP